MKRRVPEWHLLRAYGHRRHLVICGAQPHFVNDNMYGWVNVVEDDDDDHH